MRAYEKIKYIKPGFFPAVYLFVQTKRNIGSAHIGLGKHGIFLEVLSLTHFSKIIILMCHGNTNFWEVGYSESFSAPLCICTLGKLHFLCAFLNVRSQNQMLLLYNERKDKRRIRFVSGLHTTVERHCVICTLNIFY